MLYRSELYRNGIIFMYQNCQILFVSCTYIEINMYVDIFSKQIKKDQKEGTEFISKLKVSAFCDH